MKNSQLLFVGTKTELANELVLENWSSNLFLLGRFTRSKLAVNDLIYGNQT